MDLELAKRYYGISDEAATTSIPKTLYSPGDTCHESSRDDDHFALSFSQYPDEDLNDDGGSDALSARIKQRYIVSRADAQEIASKSLDICTTARPESNWTQWDMKLIMFPMPCLDPSTQKVILGYRCKGCNFSEGHVNCYRRCQLSLPGGIDVSYDRNTSRDLHGERSCSVAVAKGRLYTAEEILAHFTECTGTQELLADYALELQRPPPSETETTKRKGRKRARHA